MTKPTITYEDFARLDMHVGTIVDSLEVENSAKLLKITVDLGILGQRTILSGIKKFFSAQEMVGKQVLVLVNLEPKKMAGLESQGMILMAVEPLEEGEKITLLVPEEKVSSGTVIE